MDGTKTRKRTYSHLWVEIPSAIWPWAGGKGRMIKQQNDTRCSNTPWARGPAIFFLMIPSISGSNRKLSGISSEVNALSRLQGKF